MKFTEPQVGIFWIIGGRLITFTMPATAAPSEGGFRDYPKGHAEVWTEVQRLTPKVGEREYFVYPRGRVLLVEATDQFRVLGPASLKTHNLMIAKMARRFGLKSSRFELQVDEHYDPPDDADFEE